MPSPLDILNTSVILGARGKPMENTLVERLEGYQKICTACEETFYYAKETCDKTADHKHVAKEMKCEVCSSEEHDSCGFCARCKEHTTFVRDLDGDLHSECCDAAGNSYDYDPT